MKAVEFIREFLRSIFSLIKAHVGESEGMYIRYMTE